MMVPFRSCIYGTRGYIYIVMQIFLLFIYVARYQLNDWKLNSHELTHWGWVMHICVSKLTIIGSDNGLLPGGRQTIIWTNVGILSTGPLETNFSELLIEINTFSFKKMHLKMSSGKWRPSCHSLNVLTPHWTKRSRIDVITSLSTLSWIWASLSEKNLTASVKSLSNQRINQSREGRVNSLQANGTLKMLSV